LAGTCSAGRLLEVSTWVREIVAGLKGAPEPLNVFDAAKIAERTMRPAEVDEAMRAAHDRQPSSSSSALASLRSLVPKPSVNQP
jgi:hypothetical protein